MRIGFVGTGRMGAPMVTRLVAAGHDVVALGRTADKRAAIGALGATAVADVVELATDADAVVVCVFTDQQVRELCLDGPLIGSMAPGSVVVLHTTGSPRTAGAVAVHAETGRVSVVDAPVSGGPHDIAAGHVTVFAGGREDALARVRPILSSYGDPILHAGPTGSGQAVKLINNAVFASNIGLVSEAVSLATRLGLSEDALLQAMSHGSASSRALASIAATGSVAGFTERVGEFLTKDIAVVRQIVAELDTDLGILDDVIDRTPILRTPPR